MSFKLPRCFQNIYMDNPLIGRELSGTAIPPPSGDLLTTQADVQLTTQDDVNLTTQG